MAGQTAVEAVWEMIGSATWVECAVVLVARPDALSDDAVAYIEQTVEQNRENPSVHIVEEVRDFILDCRSRGPDAALAGRLRRSDVEVLEQRHHQVVAEGDDAARSRITQAALLLLRDGGDSRERVVWLRRLTDTLVARGLDDTDSFQFAIATLEELIDLAAREGYTEDWAWAKHNLASVLMARPDVEQ
jgi:hypothetical protein